MLTGTEPRPDVDIPTVGQAELIEIGLTYRQLDYWTTLGYLQVVGDPTPGSGRPRRWPVEEVDIALLMLRLIEAGLGLSVAARVARDGRHHLAPGIRLVIDQDEP